MEVKLLDISRYDEWNNFVSSSPQANIYNKTWYLDAVQMPYSIKIVEENGQIIGGIVTAKNRIKQYGNPLLCKYLGILFGAFEGNEYKQETRRRRICNLLVEEIKGIRSFNYNFHHTVGNFLPFYWSGYSSTTVYTYIIPLEGRDEADLHKDLQGKLRSELKYAANQPYRIIDELDFDTFYKINSKTYARQGGSNPFKPEYLKPFYNSLRDRNAISLRGIAAGDDIMAVAGLVYDENTTSFLLNGFDPDSIQRGANELLTWSCILFGKEHSRSFDFEGSMMHSIDSFYRKFGGIHTPFLRIYKDNLLNYSTQRARQLYKKFKYGK